jgi:hypothetical protein
MPVKVSQFVIGLDEFVGYCTSLFGGKFSEVETTSSQTFIDFRRQLIAITAKPFDTFWGVETRECLQKLMGKFGFLEQKPVGIEPGLLGNIISRPNQTDITGSLVSDDPTGRLTSRHS